MLHSAAAACLIAPNGDYRNRIMCASVSQCRFTRRGERVWALQEGKTKAGSNDYWATLRGREPTKKRRHIKLCLVCRGERVRGYDGLSTVDFIPLIPREKQLLCLVGKPETQGARGSVIWVKKKVLLIFGALVVFGNGRSTCLQKDFCAIFNRRRS